MTSRIWPTPTPEQLSAAATTELDDGNDVDEDEEDHVEHDFCEVCEGCITCECCECDDVFVHYATKVIVCVDWEGDITSVRVDDNLADAYDVCDENGNSLPQGKLRDRALKKAAESDWPSWDIG